MEANEVLVLQHLPAYRGLLTTFIRNLGLPVQGAGDLKTARKALSQGKVKTVVLDLLSCEPEEIREFSRTIAAPAGPVELVVLTHAPEPAVIGLSNQDLPRSTTYIWANTPNALEKLARVLTHKKSLGPKPLFKDHLSSDHALKKLSNSQRNLLIGVASGLSNQQIAENRGTTVRAVENLLKRTLNILQLQTETSGNSRVLAMRKYLMAIGGNLPRKTPSA